MNKDYQKKPPVGIIPEWRHKELRLEEINEGIGRFLEANEPIPVNWIAEQYGLTCWLKNREEEKEATRTAAANVSVSDWEIVSFVVNKSNGPIAPYNYVLESDGLYHPAKPFSPTKLESLLRTSWVDIHSVRRVSDNTIWTVGEDTPKGKIKEFELPYPDGQMYVRYDLGGWDYLYQCKKLPPPEERPVLFKDFLGNDIRKGDYFFAVQDKTFDLLRNCIHPLDSPGNWTVFKYEEDAVRYRIINKPCLSVNDVLLHVHLTTLPGELEKLKQLAQSKIK
jgi:hypothetical protein